MAIKIQVQQAFEEVSIGEKEYRIDLSDKKLESYAEFFKKYQKEAEELAKIEIEKADEEQQAEYKEQSRQLIKGMVDFLLNEGAFDEVYEVAGRSTLVMFDIINQLMEVVNKRQNGLNEKAKEYYTKKK